MGLIPPVHVGGQRGIGRNFQARAKCRQLGRRDDVGTARRRAWCQGLASAAAGQPPFDGGQADGERGDGRGTGHSPVERSQNPFAEIERIGSHMGMIPQAQPLCEML